MRGKSAGGVLHGAGRPFMIHGVPSSVYSHAVPLRM